MLKHVTCYVTIAHCDISNGKRLKPPRGLRVILPVELYRRSKNYIIVKNKNFKCFLSKVFCICIPLNIISIHISRNSKITDICTDLIYEQKLSSANV